MSDKRVLVGDMGSGAGVTRTGFPTEQMVESGNDASIRRGIRGERPLVSVIVPTSGNRTWQLQSSLASIWAQEGLGQQFDVEPIVVDDASSGPAEQVVRRFPGTQYIRFETNRGAAAARNAGLNAATGKYVAFLDDDDLWLRHRLSVQVPVLEQAQGVEVVYSQWIHVREDGTSRVAPVPEGPSGWIFEELFKTLVVHVPAVLIPRKAFDEVGVFDERLWVGQDSDMWFRLALKFPFRYVPGVVAVWVQSRREWTATYANERVREWLIKRDKVLTLVHGTPNEAEIRPFVLSGTWVYVVRLFLRAGLFDEARRALLRALAEFPPFDPDTWYGSRMRELIPWLALALDSNEATMSLCAEVQEILGRGGLKRGLKMRGFLSDVWTAVALRLASGRRRNDGMAASAAAKAILQNPLKPLSRPGLLRLVARAIAPS